MKGNDNMNTSVTVALLIVIIAVLAGIGTRHCVDHIKNSEASSDIKPIPDFFTTNETEEHALNIDSDEPYSVDEFVFSLGCWYTPASHSYFGPNINNCIATPELACELMKTLDSYNRRPLIDNNDRVVGGLQRDPLIETGIIMYDFGVYDDELDGYYGIYAFTYDLNYEYVGISHNYNTYGVMMTGNVEEGTRTFAEECYGHSMYEYAVDIDTINSKWSEWVMKCVLYRATMLMNEGA